MKSRISAFRLLAAMAAALGAFILGSVPASAQYYSPGASPDISLDISPDISQDLPWYMPQPWVHPPQTGPKIRKLPGYYGHNYRNRSYGGFGNGCYGDCRALPGTVSTGYGVTLSQPMVAIFDPRDYQLVPRTQQQTLAALPEPASRPSPVQPRVVPVGVPTKRNQPQHEFAMQNGVRIFRPSPMTTY
jgi:hypothetical protein